MALRISGFLQQITDSPTKTPGSYTLQLCVSTISQQIFAHIKVGLGHLLGRQLIWSSE